MKTWCKALLLLSISIGAASLSFGATVAGTVKGPDGASFKGAFVQAQNTGTRMLFSVLSDKDGHYKIEGLPAGDYQLQIRAPGFRTDPRKGLALTAEQNASYDFALQKGMVRWNDLSQYQGETLFPAASGKDILTGRCFACHAFQTRMASVVRDEDGWRDRVSYMHEAMHYFLDGLGAPFTDENAAAVAAYMNSLFGEESVLPKSPADLPGYKDTVRSFSDEAMKIVYVEYELPGPGRMPWSAAPDKNGTFWLPYYGKANKIGRLDPKTAEVQEYPVPNQGTAAIHSAVPAPDGSVWLPGQDSNLQPFG